MAAAAQQLAGQCRWQENKVHVETVTTCRQAGGKGTRPVGRQRAVMSTLSVGVLEAVAVKRRKQQRGSERVPREHKTFCKASRRGHSRAATGRGAGRTRCGLHEHGKEQKGSTDKNRLHQTC